MVAGELGEVVRGGFAFHSGVGGDDQFLHLARRQVLGPRGLMPNPKTGTVTADVATAVKNAKAGMAKFRTDKAGIVHCAIAAVEFDLEKKIGRASGRESLCQSV